MNYFSDDAQNINAECENCGRVLKIPRDRCTAASNEWTVSPPILCQCGTTSDKITSDKVSSIPKSPASLTHELAKLEAEKEDLERKIAQPRASAGMILVMIVVILLLAGVFSAMFGQNSPCGVFTIVAGLFGLLIYFINGTANRTAMENRLKVVKPTISDTKMRLEKKGAGNNQQNAISKVSEPVVQTAQVSATQVSTTQNLDTELRRIKKLLDDGLITDEEYQALRKKLVESA